MPDVPVGTQTWALWKIRKHLEPPTPLNSPRVTRYKSLLTAVPVTVGIHAARQPTAADCVCLRELLMDVLFLQGDSEEDLEEPSQEQR